MVEGMVAHYRSTALTSVHVRGGRRVRFWFVRRAKPGLHLFYGLRKLLRMVDEVQEKDPHIEGRAPKFPKRGGEWRAAQAAGRWDVLR